MRIHYYGKKLIKNDFGDIIKKYPPIGEIDCKENELIKIVPLVEKTGYKFDIFSDDETGTIMIYVENKEDYEEFVDIFKIIKKEKIKNEK